MRILKGTLEGLRFAAWTQHKSIGTLDQQQAIPQITTWNHHFRTSWTYQVRIQVQATSLSTSSASEHRIPGREAGIPRAPRTSLQLRKLWNHVGFGRTQQLNRSQANLTQQRAQDPMSFTEVSLTLAQDFNAGRCLPKTFWVRVARMMISVRIGVTRTSTPE